MQISRVKSYSVSAEDRPGELARIMQVFRERKVRLLAIWGFGLGGGRTWVVVVPDDARLFREVSHRAGFELIEGVCFFVKGVDGAGAMTELLGRIATEGVNVHAVDAIAVGNNFGSYIYADSGDVARLGEILNA